VRGVLAAVAAALVLAAPAFAGGPHMAIGAAEDAPEQPTLPAAQTAMSLATQADLGTIRLTATWTRGQTDLTAAQDLRLGNAIHAATAAQERVILSIFPFGSSVTPVTQAEQQDFATFAASVLKKYPSVHDVIVGNEPNLNRFWMPQFGPNGEDVAAPAYESLLATTYDAIKAADPHSTVYGGALAPRGVDKPNTGRDTHSPTAFIADLGAAYKASGRQVPIMDAFAFHPYPENSTIGPNFPHPNSTAIGLADYDKLVGLLGQAFDGTTQRGSTLPLLYDEFWIETTVPAAKADLYTGTEPATTKPVSEAQQAQEYQQALQMVFCQPNVMGLLLFHVQDEAPLAAWQSGLYYVDGTPKSSLEPVRTAVDELHRGVIATCATLHITPKLTLKTAKPTTTATRVQLTCDVDCRYTVTLDGTHRVTGTAVGGTAKVLAFYTGKRTKGRHAATVKAVAQKNAGPPGTAKLTFTS
jgi:hypothetical protein